MNVFDKLIQLNPTWRDLVDILIVAFIIYYILVLIRGTRAMQIAIGMLIVGVDRLRRPRARSARARGDLGARCSSIFRSPSSSCFSRRSAARWRAWPRIRWPCSFARARD